MDPLEEITYKLQQSLSKSYLDTRTERAFHDSVYAAALIADPFAIREYRISESDRFDIWFPEPGVCAEVKIKPRLVPVIRQLQRYAGHAVVKGLILVSVTIPPSFPETILAKPVNSLSCWKYLLQ